VATVVLRPFSFFIALSLMKNGAAPAVQRAVTKQLQAGT